MKTNTTRLYPETKAIVAKLAKDGFLPFEASGTDARQIHWLVRYADAVLRDHGNTAISADGRRKAITPEGKHS